MLARHRAPGPPLGGRDTGPSDADAFRCRSRHGASRQRRFCYAQAASEKGALVIPGPMVVRRRSAPRIDAAPRSERRLSSHVPVRRPRIHDRRLRLTTGGAADSSRPLRDSWVGVFAGRDAGALGGARAFEPLVAIGARPSDRSFDAVALDAAASVALVLREKIAAHGASAATMAVGRRSLARTYSATESGIGAGALPMAEAGAFSMISKALGLGSAPIFYSVPGAPKAPALCDNSISAKKETL